MKKVTDNLEKNILNDYISYGGNSRNVAKKYGIGHSTVLRITRKYNSSKKPYSRENPKCNENYFSIIDNEEKAYLLGLIFSDGNVHSKNSQIKLTSIDLELIQFFKNKLGIRNKILIREHINKKGEIKKIYILSVGNKNLKKDLISYGCVPCKSLIMKYPDKIIGSTFEKYFILGLYDGNGCVGVYKNHNKLSFQCNIVLVGTYSICQNVSKFLEKNNIKIKSITSHKNIFKIKFSKKKDVLEFYNIFYKIPVFSLIRKRNKIENYLKQCNLL